MKQSGLKGVHNPSEMFLEERSTNVPGSTIVATMEGTRPLLIEVQALVTPTTFNNPRRMATGIDHNRLSLLMAVLEKKLFITTTRCIHKSSRWRTIDRAGS